MPGTGCAANLTAGIVNFSPTDADTRVGLLAERVLNPLAAIRYNEAERFGMTWLGLLNCKIVLKNPRILGFYFGRDWPCRKREF